jgi:hypothetical protein
MNNKRKMKKKKESSGACGSPREGWTGPDPPTPMLECGPAMAEGGF